MYMEPFPGTNVGNKVCKFNRVKYAFHKVLENGMSV